MFCSIITVTGGVYRKKSDAWGAPFLSLELLGGTLYTLVNDDEDMLEIKWPDGMLIDVGFIKEENTYYITTVANDTLESWNNPLSVRKISDCTKLATILQNEIFRCRS